VDSTEFLGREDLYHSTQPVKDRHGLRTLLVVDNSAASWLHRDLPFRRAVAAWDASITAMGSGCSLELIRDAAKKGRD
jgi:hypothetical protein